ncbi:hypothetical protein EIL87_21895 [Saccharopolyspora rhizosphaerae]|uniref:Class I SAM-dependent methyltransferase n=1 Tax=Saccharopolyspora rhizosphaerae TaxID=2492662 RepID=A0A3R8NUM6_9PSEU|nr:hypothetical protein [Saccharopolyspora rhizosphaerae]RRO13651.1 hypothetical protein EIL87_21895 [Saccharopolyspora rhizosphaerae]
MEHRTDAGRHAVSLDIHHRQPDHVVDLLVAAGLEVRARMLRAPDHDGPFPEESPQGFVLARKSRSAPSETR